MFNYYLRRNALRLGALHFALTILAVSFALPLGEWGVVIANVLRYPALFLFLFTEGVRIPITLQWPLLILNSLLWGFILVLLIRGLRRRWVLFRIARANRRMEKNLSDYNY